MPANRAIITSKIKTLGDFREITKDLPDDFSVELRIITELPPEKLADMSYPYPYQSERATIEFDDIGYSEKTILLSVEIKEVIS